MAQTAHSISYRVTFPAVTRIGSCDAKYMTQRIFERCMFGGVLIRKDEIVWNNGGYFGLQIDFGVGSQLI